MSSLAQGLLILQITNTQFIKNKAVGGGGKVGHMICIQSNPQHVRVTFFDIGATWTTCTGCTVADNFAELKTASTIMAATTGSYFIDTDITLTDALKLASDLTITGAKITSNALDMPIITAASSKRHMITWTNILHLSNLKFISGSMANAEGGSIYVSSGGTLIATNVIWQSNSVTGTGCGGAIFFQPNTGSSTLTNTIFKSNTATLAGGGAICSKSSRRRRRRLQSPFRRRRRLLSTVTITIVDSTFEENVVDANGGAINFVGITGTLSVTKTSFIKNKDNKSTC